MEIIEEFGKRRAKILNQLKDRKSWKKSMEEGIKKQRKNKMEEKYFN